ncbi:UNVERIFIED_CONTAM: helicase-related protein [Actinomycetes bacterium ARC8]|nr:helicase-related protein [Actinomycetes bacterium ARC8]
MTSLEAKYGVRKETVDRLIADLYGPDSHDEVLTERPLERYVTGVLWPASDDVFSEVADDPQSEASEGAEGASDIGVANALQNYPSTFGATISVDLGRSTKIKVIPRAAKYVPESNKNEFSNDVAESFNWRRRAIGPVAHELDLSSVATHRITVKEHELELYVRVRKSVAGIATATIVLRNLQPKPPIGEDRDNACWFQCGIEITSEDYALTDRSKLRKSVSSDRDLATSELLYRNHMVFGVGHGCALEVDVNDIEENRCRRISTTFVPTTEVPRAKPGTTNADLRLITLGTGKSTDVFRELRTLTTEYEQWIASTEANVNRSGEAFVPIHLRPVAGHHMEEARRTLSRIRAGINLLEDDKRAFRAFQLANQAMHLQRSRQDWVRKDDKSDFMLDNEQKWRPFQLAFILLNLSSVTDRQHPERNIADLLWFPTGGGKTEAYLGLIAYLILLRRLNDSTAEGVAVIMRYTLRLLTIQQFERAAMLICSLESVRLQETPSLGQKPFSIGLWVGSAAVPNTLRDAVSALRKLERGELVAEGNPCQIKACPWCGTYLPVDSYKVIPRTRLKVSCANKNCEFADGLPVHLVDSDIYREEPELIIGTVDKFAQMSWKGEVASLFGRSSDTSFGPDLIIQDELHLISGPLGSTVGLFEAAIDLAAGGDLRQGANESYRPKIIASTATIRRASEQIRAVFDRDSRLFPPPGIAPDQSFFAESASAEELGTRQYVGVMAAGTSHTTLMVRTYASLLNSGEAIESQSIEDKDPYWTLIGYFNSLRVLGSALLQVHDDVATRLRLLARRFETNPRENLQVSELTSRRPSDQIPGALKSLEKSLLDDEVPEDVVLATNMISVGLDVDRLGLMAVMGQPQSSAEYIQATSRVGRKHPGLVVTIYNAAKTRDRSHYESFSDYHGAMYRAVEATSATPFAARARDRALHAVLVSAVRMLLPDLRNDDAAGQLRDYNSKVQQLADALVDRAMRTNPQDPSVARATRRELDELLATWKLSVDQDDKLEYRNWRNPQTALLVDASQALDLPDIPLSKRETPWPTPTSMRDVDAQTGLRPSFYRNTATSNAVPTEPK